MRINIERDRVWQAAEHVGTLKFIGENAQMAGECAESVVEAIRKRDAVELHAAIKAFESYAQALTIVYSEVWEGAGS